jgi:hypothetical protein
MGAVHMTSLDKISILAQSLVMQTRYPNRRFSSIRLVVIFSTYMPPTKRESIGLRKCSIVGLQVHQKRTNHGIDLVQ